MNKVDQSEMSFDDWDEVNFPRPTEQEFDRVVERALLQTFHPAAIALPLDGIMLRAAVQARSWSLT